MVICAEPKCFFFFLIINNNAFSDDPSTSPCAAKDSRTITWASWILLGTVIVLLLIVSVLLVKLNACQAFEGVVWKKDGGKKGG